MDIVEEGKIEFFFIILKQSPTKTMESCRPEGKCSTSENVQKTMSNQ